MFGISLSIYEKIWALIFFIGIPSWFTFNLFFGVYPLNKVAFVFSLISIFITSFENVFKRNHELLIFPQLLKMVLSVYIAIIGFASIYKTEGLIQAGNITHKPTDALYFSIVTWTTLGYGDLLPTEPIKLIAAIEALLGTLFIPLLLTAITFNLQSKVVDSNSK